MLHSLYNVIPPYETPYCATNLTTSDSQDRHRCININDLLQITYIANMSLNTCNIHVLQSYNKPDTHLTPPSAMIYKSYQCL